MSGLSARVGSSLPALPPGQGRLWLSVSRCSHNCGSRRTWASELWSYPRPESWPTRYKTDTQLTIAHVQHYPLSRCPSLIHDIQHVVRYQEPMWRASMFESLLNTVGVSPTFWEMITHLRAFLTWALSCCVQTYRELLRMTEGVGFRVHIIDKASLAAKKYGPQSNKKYGKKWHWLW